MKLKPGLLPIIALVAVAVWAVFAVGTLTATLLSAKSIEDDVKAINVTYPEVAGDIRNIPLAFDTGRIADEISTTVAPVGPQFTTIVDGVKSIEGSVGAIDADVASIHSDVLEINSSVHSIDNTVTQIDGGMTIVGGHVADINKSVHKINDSFSGIVSDVNDIDDRIAIADAQTRKVIDGVLGIKRDLDKVRYELVPDINANADAIEHSPVLQLDVASVITFLVQNYGLQVPTALPAEVPAVAEELPLNASEQVPAPKLPADAPAEVPDPGAPVDVTPESGGGLFGSLGNLF